MKDIRKQPVDSSQRPQALAIEGQAPTAGSVQAIGEPILSCLKADGHLTNIIIYDNISGVFKVITTMVFNDWLNEQSPEVMAEATAVILLLREHGHRLARPHADTLKGSKYANMKELRARTSQAEIRIAFAFDPQRQAIVLVAGDKRGVNEKRFYKQLIAKADALFTEYLQSR